VKDLGERAKRMHLVVDVGNTETVIGLFEPESLDVLAHWRYATVVPRTPDEMRLLVRGFLEAGGFRLGNVGRIVIGSVVPVHTELLLRTLSPGADAEIILLEGASGLPIRLAVDEPPQGVGADRIANTLAAAHLYRRDVIVVDLGTATTYDCITGDGVFLGGVIAPGITAGEEWLAGRTAKLPRVAFRPPDRVIGRRTEMCLQSGIFYSAVDAVDGLVSRIVEEWGRPDIHVVATGGHAASVAPHSSRIVGLAPHLTLIGLELAGAHLAGAQGT
jgi:type III pantothenate kinase